MASQFFLDFPMVILTPGGLLHMILPGQRVMSNPASQVKFFTSDIYRPQQ